jgi:hypothetical protein
MAFEVKGRALVATMRTLERAPGGPDTILRTLPAEDRMPTACVQPVFPTVQCGDDRSG